MAVRIRYYNNPADGRTLPHPPATPVCSCFDSRLTPVRPTSINAGAHGTLRGVDILGPNGEHKARRFTAIPYAHPPVGELRWRRPKPLADDHSWSDIDAANFGGLAPQPVYDIRK